MKNGIYTVHDNETKLYGAGVQVMGSDTEAKRWFEEIIMNNLAKNSAYKPEIWSLVKIGYWDNEKGEFTNENTTLTRGEAIIEYYSKRAKEGK